MSSSGPSPLNRLDALVGDFLGEMGDFLTTPAHDRGFVIMSSIGLGVFVGVLGGILQYKANLLIEGFQSTKD